MIDMPLDKLDELQLGATATKAPATAPSAETLLQRANDSEVQQLVLVSNVCRPHGQLANHAHDRTSLHPSASIH